jgi:hypothetical protein
MSEHLSPFALEAAGQRMRMAPDEAQRIQSHLAACEDCRRTLDEVQAARSKFDREVGPRTKPAIVRRFERRAFFTWAPTLLVPALCALAIVWGTHHSPEAEFGIKGDFSVHVFALRAKTVFPVANGEHLATGDRLRFEIRTGGLPYLLVTSIDAAGHASVYIPFGGTESVSVDPDRQFVSPGSLELEAVPGPERVFAFASKEPISTSAIEPFLRDLGSRGPDAIRKADRLPLSSAFEVIQRSFLWENGVQ